MTLKVVSKYSDPGVVKATVGLAVGDVDCVNTAVGAGVDDSEGTGVGLSVGDSVQLPQDSGQRAW